MRNIKDLDQAATVLATACRTLLDPTLESGALCETVFARISRERQTEALESVDALVRPPNDVYYNELNERYRAIRIFYRLYCGISGSDPTRQVSLCSFLAGNTRAAQAHTSLDKAESRLNVLRTLK